jgi:DNA-binding transcriptional LysR family regulator
MDHRGHLAGVDLPLLTALKELLDSESVSVAARRIGSTQPNMSRTLARLRVLFEDPLLVQVGRGLQRTTRANELLPRVERALDSMRELLSPRAPFAPHEEKRVVRIAASDYTTAVVLDPWLARLRRDAPGVIVEVEPIGVWTIDPLARGELDLAIAPRLPVVGLDQFVFREVLVDRFVCALRAGHPELRAKLTMRAYLALDHVVVGALAPAVSAVHAAIHRLGKVRRVVARVPTFMSALRLASTSDLAATVPARLVRDADHDIVTRSLPFVVEKVSENLVWHPRRTMEPFHRWLRDGIMRAARSALDPPARR